MANIYYEYPHSIQNEEVAKRIKSLMFEFQKKYGFTATWKDDSHLKVKGKGVDGAVELRENLVVFDLSLAFFLAPFKGKIEEGIVSELKRALT